MPDWLAHSQYVVAFITGLLGGVHCFGMCGGIVGALTLNTGGNSGNRSIHDNDPDRLISQLIITLGYNIGRIAGYVVAGALVGFLGATLVDLGGIQAARQVLAIIASLFMIALGFYLAGIWQGISKLESIGTHLWKHIQPFSKQFMPVRSLKQAIPLGFLWGWLPCGLVYTALIWTLSAGGAVEGALLMLAFGLGTLPNLLAMGIVASLLEKWVRNPGIRLIAGLLVVAMGIITLFRAFIF